MGTPYNSGIFDSGFSANSESSLLCLDLQQKVVIKLSVHDEKSRSKAMKTAVGVDGKLPNTM